MGEDRIHRPFAVLMSPSHRVMSRAAHFVLGCIEVELARTGNNGLLRCSSADFARFGVSSRRSASLAIRELEVLGLVEVTRIRGKPSLYRITFHGRRQRSHGTNEWRRFQTLSEARQAKRAARAIEGATA